MRDAVITARTKLINNLRGWFADEHMVSTAARRSAERAFAMAGLGPRDVDTAQLYDFNPLRFERLAAPY